MDNAFHAKQSVTMRLTRRQVENTDKTFAAVLISSRLSPRKTSERSPVPFQFVQLYRLASVAWISGAPRKDRPSYVTRHTTL